MLRIIQGNHGIKKEKECYSNELSNHSIAVIFETVLKMSTDSCRIQANTHKV